MAALLIGLSMARDCAAAMGVLVPAVEHHSDEPRAALPAQLDRNGVLVAGATAATRLMPHPSPNGGAANGASANGTHPDADEEVARGNGTIGMPAPVRMHERGLHMTERDE
jgi:hypothetical protein